MPRGRPKKVKCLQVENVHSKEDISENKTINVENIPVIEEKNIEIDKDRKSKLNGVLRDLNKKFGDVTINFANTIGQREKLSWGYDFLDKLTGGGISKGIFTTIWGSKGCGKTTIAYKAIATTQKQGKIAAYIDMERSYDVAWATKFGVDVNNLVYIACHTAEEALDVIIKMCKEKVIDLIVLDSIQGMSPHDEQFEGKAEKERSIEADSMALLARKLSQFFRMSVSHVSDAKCAVLLIGQARLDLGSFIKCEILSGGHALQHNSRLIIRARRGQKADAPFETRETEEVDERGKNVKEKQQVGFDLVLSIEKSQVEGCTEGNNIHVAFYYGDGIHEN